MPTTVLGTLGLVLRTRVLTADSPTIVARVWASGPQFGNPDWPSVLLVLDNPAAGETVELACSEPDIASARGVECVVGDTASALGGWYSADGDVVVTAFAKTKGYSPTLLSDEVPLLLAQLPPL
jgi:hypothetical protein